MRNQTKNSKAASQGSEFPGLCACFHCFHCPSTPPPLHPSNSGHRSRICSFLVQWGELARRVQILVHGILSKSPPLSEPQFTHLRDVHFLSRNPRAVAGAEDIESWHPFKSGHCAGFQQIVSLNEPWVGAIDSPCFALEKWRPERSRDLARDAHMRVLAHSHLRPRHRSPRAPSHASPKHGLP